MAYEHVILSVIRILHLSKKYFKVTKVHNIRLHVCIMNADDTATRFSCIYASFIIANSWENGKLKQIFKTFSVFLSYK